MCHQKLVDSFGNGDFGPHISTLPFSEQVHSL